MVSSLHLFKFVIEQYFIFGLIHRVKGALFHLLYALLVDGNLPEEALQLGRLLFLVVAGF